MAIIFKVIISVLIVCAAITIPGMIIDCITGFKYEWIGKVLDKIFAVFLPVLYILGFAAIVLLAGMLLHDIWCT